jgi:probable FeS assembly SUF system protein SufT
MPAQEYAIVSREVRAVEIPQGTPTVLAAGTHVRIAQALGGSYTVVTDQGQLVRIEARDADAIGKQPVDAWVSGETAEGSIEDQVWTQLKTCFDPEIPVNIVDLGLVYNCEVTPLPEGGSRVDIKMTLTAPGCGMGPVLASDVKSKVESIPGVERAEIEVVWDPQWNPNMMTEAARLQLGFF